MNHTAKARSLEINYMIL